MYCTEHIQNTVPNIIGHNLIYVSVNIYLVFVHIKSTSIVYLGNFGYNENTY